MKTYDPAQATKSLVCERTTQTINMRLRGSVLGKPPASGNCLPVNTFLWFAGAVPTVRL